MKQIVYLVFILFSMPVGYSQCCSPGNPVAGTANVGILNKGKFRAINFYRHSFSDQYFEKSTKTEYTLLKGAGFDYTGIIFGYGLIEKVTLEVESGYFIQKYQLYNLDYVYKLNSSGFTSAVFSTKVNVFNNAEKEWELTTAVGVKFPYSTKLKEVNNVILPQELQPSSGAKGLVTQLFLRKGYSCKKLMFIVLNRTEINGSNPQNYSYGTSSVTTFIVSKAVTKSTSLAMLFRNEVRMKDSKNNFLLPSSGAIQFFASPMINYRIKTWNFSATLDVPTYQYMNGRQLGNKYAVSAIIMKDF
ncbi:MAG: hypothetical protein ACLGGV_01495 [Bacteroidia bacterium]